MRSALAIVLVLAGAGCAGMGDDARLPRLGIEFNWSDVPVCSNVSPRLIVQGAPPGTARFRVELVDKDSALARHGGGEVAADPSGVIPQGALQSYRGPCPSQITVKYEMRVAALDAGGKILARGTQEKAYEPASLSRTRRR